MGNRLPFSGEIEFITGSKIAEKRIARFKDELGHAVAKAAAECFEDYQLDNITIGEVPRYAVPAPYGRPHPAECYTVAEWLGDEPEDYPPGENARSIK